MVQKLFVKIDVISENQRVTHPALVNISGINVIEHFHTSSTIYMDDGRKYKVLKGTAEYLEEKLKMYIYQ